MTSRIPKFLRVWKLNPAWVRAQEPTLSTIRVDRYLTGNVVPVRKVPRAIRRQYRDTLARFALALHRSGYGPNGKGRKHVNSSYRSIDEQRALYAKNMDSVTGRPKPGRPLTAVPNPNAPHVRGVALDVDDVRLEHPLIDECRKLGLMDDVPSERWHLTNHGYGG